MVLHLRKQVVAIVIVVYADSEFARIKRIGWKWVGVFWLYTVYIATICRHKFSLPEMKSPREIVIENEVAVRNCCHHIYFCGLKLLFWWLKFDFARQNMKFVGNVKNDM